ncbi:methyltransferase domain-containing protein [Thalassotalea euphylliae]|uniref:Ribosomal RNA large subunit methyltransferase G n=1 Tax=Thalassotalea euphylliae TaxID=1655234 RepID=A0A3E0TWS5_9GAMM|nr:methyltransferase [Thalassotalea euphylliae]REL28793.1 methyltransferase domain-containing protein [Thalassotalea euphylliae]
MQSPFIFDEQPLRLSRFPLKQVNRSLQAWDATDEYLLSHCQQDLLTSPKRVLVFNDSFGALAANLSHHQVFSVSDSYLAHQGCRHNLDENELNTENVHLLTSLDELPPKVDVILYRIPKSNALLSYQLSLIANTYSANADQTGDSEKVTFIAGARAKDIHTSTLKLFEKYLGTTSTSLAKKKSRLVFSQLEHTHKTLAHQDCVWPLIFEQSAPSAHNVSDHNFSIHNLAGVFSRDSLDIGARFLLEHLPALKPGQRAIDLGCGNGVLGLSLLAKQPSATLVFKDESFMAVASAEQNIRENLPTAHKQCHFSADDCLTLEASNSADIIVCNPPFHQQHATTDHIAWQMFNDAKRVLKPGGELRIIGNRQLGYHVKLQRVFSNCKTIASNKKFVVLSSIKR